MTKSTLGPELALPHTGVTRDAEGEAKAKVFGLYADTWSRLLMVVAIAVIFVGLNYSVMDFIKTVFAADVQAVKASPGTARVVTTQVLMSLIGATVVQVGVALVAIVSYLFPKGRAATT